MACGCLMVAAYADDPVTEPETPEASPSGVYVGKIYNVGDEITSFYKADSCAFTYTVNQDFIPNVKSALSEVYSPSTPVSQYRDNIASFNLEETDESGEGKVYGGKYNVKGQGDLVDEMRVEDGTWKTSVDIKKPGEVDKKDDKNKKAVDIKIDFVYKKDTMLQYTTITGWKVISYVDNDVDLRIAFEAVWSTREPTAFEAFGEKVYAAFMKVHDEFLDILGDRLIELTPKFFEAWAELLKSLIGE